MPFTPENRNSFDQWCGAPSWHSEHSFDRRRFYEFVWAVIDSSAGSADDVTQNELEQAIIELHGEQSLEHVQRFSALYCHLREFARLRIRHSYTGRDATAVKGSSSS
jgi:hypothetical protein